MGGPMTPLPFHFVVVFWGAEHREYFLRLLVPSLLAPGNIPALEDREGSRLVVVTTAEDWAALQGDADFEAARRAIEPLWLEIPMPAPGDNKYLAMSSGHRIATERAFADGAYGVFVTPDLVLADGAVVALQRLARQGVRVVLCAAMRFTFEGAVDEVRSFRKRPGEPLVLPPRRLADIALRHMHVETLRYDWDAPFFAEMPFSPFWRVAGGEGIVVHSLGWAPLLAAYRGLERHDTQTFESWTMDGDYINRNFGGEAAVHVTRDSDELLLVSFTPMADRPGHLGDDALAPRWYNRIPVISHYWKLDKLRWLIASSNADPLKQRIFPLSVRLHGGTMSPGPWRRAEARAARVVRQVTAPPTALERACVALVLYLRRSTWWPLSLLHRPGPMPAVKAVDRSLLNQSGVGSHRVARLGPPLSSGRWYWEVFSPNLGAAGPAVAATGTVGVVGDRHSLVHEIGFCGPGWGWRGDGHKIHARAGVRFGEPASHADEVIMVALDMDTRRLWFGRNGAWFGGGDPARGTTPAFAGIQHRVYPAMSSMHGGSGTADLQARVVGSGFAFRPPAGFRPLTEAAVPEIGARPGDCDDGLIRGAGNARNQTIRSNGRGRANRCSILFHGGILGSRAPKLFSRFPCRVVAGARQHSGPGEQGG
jgi:hypothetical protein